LTYHTTHDRIIKVFRNGFTKRREAMAEKGYCVKCKGKKDMKDEQKVTMKNKRLAVKGKCPDCGTGMYKILGNK
jgi:hypothetical protein